MKSKTLLLVGLFTICSVSVVAQKHKLEPAPKKKAIIFAVVNDGSWLEPIASVENGNLIENAGTNEKSFASSHYKPNSPYQLIFGGAQSGTVIVESSNIGKECGGSSASISVRSAKVHLKGFVMALATDVKVKQLNGYRRKPTLSERFEIEALVRTEFSKQKVSTVALKNLHYYNLTALDIDGDGKAEFVGSYWVATKPDRRDLLFFIAEKGSSDKYSFSYSDYAAVGPDGLMSGDVKDLDTMGGEILLDVLDYDNDGVSEIFTIAKAFEGNNYHVYKRSGRKWTRVHDTYDYRCAY